jgi:Na+-transporting NADH:ubiquinone oxidoreductase subunit F
MPATAIRDTPEASLSDYSLVGVTSEEAVRKGLAEAEWYQSPVPREIMRELLERRNGPAIRDTLLWFGLLGLFGTFGAILWPSPWAILPLLAYGVIYASSSDSRWHETSHGTAFKTDWMNNVLYEIASFMVKRESTLWRWSHTRHHSDTIIVGRDPEIAVPRPPNMKNFWLTFTGWPAFSTYFKKVFLHSTGRLDPEEAAYVPESEVGKIVWRARLTLALYAAIIGSCFAFGTVLPLLLFVVPNLYGSWLMPVYGYTQHAGLAENVLDHRMNCRTVYMNPIHRFLYWNMNYHVEHHMFPLVPYHNLPRLHAIVKDDMPTPYSSLLDAWREIVPAVLRQRGDPGYYVKRKLPTPTARGAANVAAKTVTARGAPADDGWIELGETSLLEREDVLRFDCGQRTFAVVRTGNDEFYAVDGICTHGNAHLAAGFVQGHQIECPKHNGRFDLRDGSPCRAPVCRAIRTAPVRVRDGRIFLNVLDPSGEPAETIYRFRVESNDNVATYIKELVLTPVAGSPELRYQPGQYLQFHIPAYGSIAFRDFDIRPPHDAVWRVHHVFDCIAENHSDIRRNYSFCCNPHLGEPLRFNIRIAAPPRGQDCPAGAGSSYMWNLRPGDEVTAVGPFGDFLVKDTDREMIYLGGGSGMSPLRAHLSYLLETLQTGRTVSYWYGARSRRELYYVDYFEELASRFINFRYVPALSEPLPDDGWQSHVGFIHEVLYKDYLSKHPNPADIEYYLCGPQPMVQAARAMLEGLGVGPAEIAYDEF